MHIPHPFHQSNQRGDTIVEVLIAMAVISSVLAGAFFVTNRSTNNVRDSEEHAQALQLLQGQVEQLRSDATTAGTIYASMPKFFCYSPARVRVIASSSNDFTKCGDNLGGSSGVTYQFLIITGPQIPGLFTAQVQWPSINGTTNTEQLLYRLPLP